MERDEMVQRILKLRKQVGVPEIPTGVKLFSNVSGDDRDAYAIVGHMNTWDAIAEGYRRAADLVTDYVLSTGNEQDFLVYTCFLYRCYLEVRLKEILAYVKGSKGVSGYGHNLTRLWEDAQPIVAHATFTMEEELRLIREYVAQFQEVDPRGDGFRYPSDKAGRRTLPTISQFSLKKLKDVMAGIAALLDGASTGLYEEANADHSES